MNFIKRYWRIIFPAFFIILIWVLSSKTGEASDQQSIGIANFLGWSNAFTRKAAHVVLFAGLGYSLSSFFKGLNPFYYPTKTAMFAAMGITTVYAAIDEMHQLLVPGRSASVADIFIDLFGAIVGTLIYIIIFTFFRRWRFKHLAK